MSKLTRDFLSLLERCTYADDYGVDGSTFYACRVCECESGAGLLHKPNWHAPGCPVPRLQSKYVGKGQRPRGEQ